MRSKTRSHANYNLSNICVADFVSSEVDNQLPIRDDTVLLGHFLKMIPFILGVSNCSWVQKSALTNVIHDSEQIEMSLCDLIRLHNSYICIYIEIVCVCVCVEFGKLELIWFLNKYSDVLNRKPTERHFCYLHGFRILQNSWAFWL